jgi:DNA-binding GntR family transcriptional regulator
MATIKNKTEKIGLKKSIYQDLRQKLISCYYSPGSRINELELTQEYNVSRTPIREAISQLEMDGYVKILPKKGIYVTDITLDDVDQIFNARMEIEPVTLRMAKPYLSLEKLMELKYRINNNEKINISTAYQSDAEMHLYFIDCCHNHYLINMMHKLFDDNERVVIATGQNKVKIHNAVVEHTQILDSLIANKSIDESCDLMRQHIRTCRLAALNYLNSDKYKESHQTKDETVTA